MPLRGARRLSGASRHRQFKELVRPNPCRFMVTPPNRSVRFGTAVRICPPLYTLCANYSKSGFSFFSPSSPRRFSPPTAHGRARVVGLRRRLTLTPEQARQALAVLNDPKRRAQVADTLQAIAAAGALSAPPAFRARGRLGARCGERRRRHRAGGVQVQRPRLATGPPGRALGRPPRHVVAQFGRRAARRRVGPRLVELAIDQPASARRAGPRRVVAAGRADPRARARMARAPPAAPRLQGAGRAPRTERRRRRASRPARRRRAPTGRHAARRAAVARCAALAGECGAGTSRRRAVRHIRRHVGQRQGHRSQRQAERQTSLDAAATPAARAPDHGAATAAACGIRRRGERADVDLHRRRHAARPRARFADRHLRAVPRDRDRQRLLPAAGRAAPASVAHERCVGRLRAALDGADRQRGRRGFRGRRDRASRSA